MPCMLFNSFAESVPLLLCLLPPWDGLSEQSHFWWGGCHLLYSICFLVWCGSSRALTVLSISLATNMNRPSSRILWAMYWCLDFTRPCFAYNESPYLQIRESFLMWNDIILSHVVDDRLTSIWGSWYWKQACSTTLYSPSCTFCLTLHAWFLGFAWGLMSPQVLFPEHTETIWARLIILYRSFIRGLLPCNYLSPAFLQNFCIV